MDFNDVARHSIERVPGPAVMAIVQTMLKMHREATRAVFMSDEDDVVGQSARFIRAKTIRETIDRICREHLSEKTYQWVYSRIADKLADNEEAGISFDMIGMVIEEQEVDNG